jgi:uncharacterized repeat protein (TIGR03803 family)
MKKNVLSSVFPLLVLMLVGFASAGAAAVSTETPIVRFNVTNGFRPITGLISDAQGNMYGTTVGGGSGPCFLLGCGVVFELSKGANGTLTEKTIYAFKGDKAGDTDMPQSNLIFDAKGNLFGATGLDYSGYFGAIYELSPGAGGVWTEKILYRFTQDAYNPGLQLAFDSKGNLYGIALVGNLNGIVFQLSPQADGSWKESTLCTFDLTDYPSGGVVLDGKGNIYGTTQQGGTFDYGTVYKVSPEKGGSWKKTTIYNFMEQGDGAYPTAPLMIDANGNLFGTTFFGGKDFYGVVFELSPSGGSWNETVLYTFGGPIYGPSGVVFDKKGNLYGITANGGTGCNFPGCGTVFRLTPQAGGTWKNTTLHNFESADDGSASQEVYPAGVLLDPATGYIYGTTQYGGGRYGYGTVFELKP